MVLFTSNGILDKIFLVGFFLSTKIVVTGQELEARSVENMPVGINMVLAGYGYTTGNTLLDPALPVENLNGHMHGIVGGYARTFRLFDKPVRVDGIVPYIPGDWEYTLADTLSSRTINGFGDPRLRITVLFSGAKALDVQDFVPSTDGRVFGASLQLFLPFGQYDPEELINLGSNRWTFRLQGGMRQSINKWAFEVVTGIWIFTNNNKFLVDRKLSQRPMWVAKTHFVRKFKKGYWLALDVGYGFGGRVFVNNQERDVRISAMRFGLTGSIPITPKHIIKIHAASGIRFERGPDNDIISIGYSFVW